ncbi:hypothetical protein AC1031_004118 [Aphanomyces cochlioides]|nr:hypothetical protein AC1031_004118 [Aphanomyces cochlioides]
MAICLKLSSLVLVLACAVDADSVSNVTDVISTVPPPPLPTPLSTIKKAYIGLSVWVVCMILGILFARRILQTPDLASHSFRSSPFSSNKEEMSWLEAAQNSSTHTGPVKSRSSTSSQSIVPNSLRSLGSLASTTLFATSNSAIVERSSKAADVNVPRYVARDSDIPVTPTTVVRWHTELQDLSEETCFESMRTRVSKVSWLDEDDAVAI